MSSLPKPLKVAILDDYQSLSTPHLSDFSSSEVEFTHFQETLSPYPDPRPLIDRLKGFHVICTMRERTPFPRAVIEGLEECRVVLTTGMRNLGLDLEAFKEKGIVVAGTSVIPSPTKDLAITVQHTWALILSLTNNIPRDHNLIPAGKWLNATPLNTYIGGQHSVLIGLGKLGAGVARIATLAFGMKVIAWSPNLTQERADEAAQEAGLDRGTWKSVSKEDVFAQSDILSVQIILSDSTRGLIKKSDLEKMKSSSFFVNTSRGPIVDEGDLLDVLESGKIRGAALDVFDVEPLPLDSRWRTTKWGEEGRSEVVMTPHSGYAFERHMEGMWVETKENLERLVRGKDVKNRMA